MLRIVQQQSEAGAKSYFKASDRAGYYAEGGDAVGLWGGLAAKMLGLEGEVTWKEYERLCENRHPQTGEKLTPMSRVGRRVGYDVSFHAPKSFSLLYEWTLDPDLLTAFNAAVNETMVEIEEQAMTRVRRGGVSDDSRQTGNLCHATFFHRTTRPLDDGEPDPHSHFHVFVFNVTHDREEQRFKALDFSVAKKQARYFEACFHSRLCWKLRELGYPLSLTRKGWEIAGVSEALRGKFSRRTKEIEELAAKLKVRNPDEKAKLGAKTRNSKSKLAARCKEPEDLRAAWAGRMTVTERETLSAIQRNRTRPAVNGLTAELTDRAIDRSLGHHFERSSTVPKLKILETALRWSLGWVLPIHTSQNVEKRLGEKSLLQRGEKLTSPQILQEELRLVQLAKAARGSVSRIGAQLHSEDLSPEQTNAIQGLLDSTDRISLLVGRAGTGKTTLLKSLKATLGNAGFRLRCFAPTANASRGVLREEGFLDAETVARLLEDTRLQQSLSEADVLLIDEAGMLPLRAAIRLAELSETSKCRIILCGDPSQHGAVERGSVFELLQWESGCVPATLREIRRQRGEYKRAVTLFADGEVEQGLNALDNLGWVNEEADLEKRIRALAKEYAACVASKKTVLVVSPTHAEGEAATIAIREELRERELLGEERVLSTLQPVKMTEAERQNPSSYVPGDVVLSYGGAHSIFEEGGELPKAKRWEVFRKVEMPVAVGDVLRVTKNGKSLEGRELRNGATYSVLGFTKDGDVKLSSGFTLSAESAFVTHGYISTSHSSQGRTVDRVLILQSAESRPASSMEQAYVSVSRGRESAKVFTDFKAELLEAVKKSEDRETAIDLLGIVTERWQGFKDWLLGERERGRIAA